MSHSGARLWPKIVLASVALVVVAVAVLWILKPWLPPLELTDPGPTGKRVVRHGLSANYFPGPAGRRAPAILMLGGSEGGINADLTRAALAAQREGFAVLTPSYFGAPGQSKNLQLIPLETFDRALTWLESRSGVDVGRIAVVGSSKGAEAALLVATRHPELKAVVAIAPSSVVWPGINWNSFRSRSTWTSSGRPLSFVPYAGIPFFGDIGRVYKEALKYVSKYPDAAIPIERAKASVLLVCGEDDKLWPSCTMSRQLKARRPSVRILAYDHAGHEVGGVPLSTNDPHYKSLARWGGTPVGNNAARADSWPKILTFLRTELS